MTAVQNSGRTITVRVVLSVEVDGAIYGETYCRGPWPTDLRRDVREHIAGDIRQSAAAEEGAIVGVEVLR